MSLAARRWLATRDLVGHVAFPLAVVLHRRARASRRRVAELERIAAFAADLVRELEPVDLARVAHDLVIIATWTEVDDAEAQSWEAKRVFVDAHNRIRA